MTSDIPGGITISEDEPKTEQDLDGGITIGPSHQPKVSGLVEGIMLGNDVTWQDNQYVNYQREGYGELLGIRNINTGIKVESVDINKDSLINYVFAISPFPNSVVNVNSNSIGLVKSRLITEITGGITRGD